MDLAQVSEVPLRLFANVGPLCGHFSVQRGGLCGEDFEFRSVKSQGSF